MVQYEYAKAIFELATENNKLKQIANELDAICKLLLDSDFKSFMLSPSIAKANKKNLIKECLKDFDDLFIDFINVLIDNERISVIDDIKIEFDKLAFMNEMSIDVIIYSNNLLSDDEINKLKPIIEEKFKKKKINVKNIANKELIGGVKIVAGDEEIDLSIKKSISNLKNML